MTSYKQGTAVWIKHDEEVWAQAEIVTANDKEKIVKTVENPNDRVVLGPNEPIFLRSEDSFTSEGLTVLDDLTQLTHLHEPAVLSSLQNRFDVDKIYTFTGPILIALNPFKLIRGLYDEELLRSFISTTPSTKPHVFNTANAAFRGICDRQKSQTVLISGESGAGKTETTKHVMKFLATAGAEDGKVTSVEQQVLESNPLLEAFGNARTLRNDNSSRFGKFIELQFKPTVAKDAAASGVSGGSARLCGARIQTYLLEKVRVADQQEGERNYHLFYEGCKAAMKCGGTKYNFPQILPKEKVKQEDVIDLEGFSDLGNFAYLTRSTCVDLAGVDDVEMFECRINAMQTIGISKEDIQAVLQSVAAVLHMGNLKFEAPPNNSEGSQVMDLCRDSLEMAAKLTGVTADGLQKALCNLTRIAVKDVVVQTLNVRTASDNRDSLAKALYGIVFGFIVSKTNTSIGYLNDVKLFAGVLDIFGFECFKMNSFEQLCINFTNERLQQFFNSFVFKLEEKLYAREEIPWDPLDFPDNQDSVEILSDPKVGGIFSMLDEECAVPNGSDSGFCNKVIRKHTGHRRFDVIKVKPTWFVIKHFAGPVPYCTDSFLDKNKDQLSNDIIECMGNSSLDFIKNLFRNDIKYQEAFSDPNAEKDTKKKKAKYSVSSEFKAQLSSLMEIVDKTDPHFIRCIKPNPQNKPDIYDRKGVTEQLRYGGVLQVVQVSRAGYPVRINHEECWNDYKIIAQSKIVEALKHVDDKKTRAQKLMEHLNTELNIPAGQHGHQYTWAVGKTLVFFKQVAYERVKFARLDLLIKSATVLQAKWRCKIQRDMYKALRIFTRHSQALLRTKQARLDLHERRKQGAAAKIQSLLRRAKARKEYQNIRRKVVRLQVWRKCILARRRAKEQKIFRSASKIQKVWRGKRDHEVYKQLRMTIAIAQQRYRMNFAKAQLRKLKSEAREVGAIMAKQHAAQSQVMELKTKCASLEVVEFQLQAEKKNLTDKAKSLEDTVAEMKVEMEALRKHTQDAATQAAQSAQDAVESDAMVKMKEVLSEKDALKEQLKTELAEAKEAFEKTKAEYQNSEKKYQQLLQMQAQGGGQASRAQPRPGGKSTSNRNVDIQVVGFQGVGKTALLEQFIKEKDGGQLDRFNEQKVNLMSHHQIKVSEGGQEKLLKVLDCSGNPKARKLVNEWYARSKWVFVVYDMSKSESLDDAMDLASQVSKAGARCVLFGNKYHVEKDGAPVQADIMSAKDCAVQNDGIAIESSSLNEAVKLVLKSLDEQVEAEATQPPEELPSGSRNEQSRTSISLAIDSMKNWFGGPQRGGSNQGVLKPSLKGTKSMKTNKREGDVNADLRPVQELQDSESAVTCICFGQERLHKAYVLLATASKDGTVVIYRCYRTEMEMSMLADNDFPQEDDPAFNQPPADHSNIAVHSRLVGHSRAITSVFFNLLEDQLVTTSIDKSVRFWGVDSGEMLKVFTDSSPVPVASFLPFNPQVFVAANSNAVLRLVNVQNGMVLQKLKVETEVRALKFDDTGLFLLAGTKNGSIHVLEASDSNTLKFKFKVQLARGGVTCITFVPATNGQPACLLVNTSDSSATIIDCTYGPPTGVLTNLAVRHRVRVAHSLLPLKCCYSPSGQGYLISGSEDKEVYIYSLAKGSNYKMQYLKHHQVPVVAVAVNLQDTLLASADSLGRVVLWRRMDFSHIPD
eukprot:CAMPEP_0169080892 /NCGR_PEP_ID=MMETSP1015-20121227/10721_1 /TAXON_ID=342587 /ORGANISM="Karlodinium micrum, Strain CCMP2283" /LENGTH=1694 /DNA_ID=CAMNT_0009140647 /DNA_START=1 /DNA_END=5085 /DNA_ORIENTATION=+